MYDEDDDSGGAAGSAIADATGTPSAKNSGMSDRTKTLIRGVFGVPMPPSSTGNGGGFPAGKTAITGNTASNPAPSKSGAFSGGGGVDGALVGDDWSKT